MKISLFLPVILLAFVVFACTSTSEEKDTASSFVQFGFHQWEKGSFDCNEPKEKCAVVKLNYPEAIFGDEKVRNSINTEIREYVSSELAKAARTPMDSKKSVQDLAEATLANFDPENKHSYTEVSVFGQVMFRNQNLIKLELSTYLKSMEGKVNSNRTLYTFDSKEGKILSQTNLNKGAPKLAEISMND